MAKTFGVVFELGAKLDDSVSSSFSTIEKRLENMGKSSSQLKKENDIQLKAAGKLMETYDRLKLREEDYAKNQTKETEKALNRAKKAFESAAAAAKQYGINIDNVSASKDILKNRSDALQKKLNQQQLFRQQAVMRQEFQSRMWDAVAIAATAAVPIKLAMDFETSFADIKKAHDFQSVVEEKAMRDSIMNVSNTTGLGLGGTASIYASAAEKKLATTLEEFETFSLSAAQMAVSFGITAKEAGEYFGVWRSRMGMTQEEAIRTADAMNYLGTQMDAPPAKVAAIVSSMGALAQSGGLADAEIAALGATLAATSNTPEIAATAMKTFMLALTSGDSVSDRQFGALKQIGFDDPQALAKAMQENGAATLQAVIKALASMPKELHGSLLSDLFGKVSIESLSPLLENISLMTKAFDSVADEQIYAGSMLKEYEIQSQTTAHTMNRFISVVSALGTVIGDALLPPLVTFMDTVSDLVVPMIDLVKACPEVVVGVGIIGAGFVAVTALGFAASTALIVFSTAIGILGVPVLAVAGAVIALAAGVIYLWDTIKDVVGWGPETGGVASRMYTPSVDNAKASTRPKAEPTFMDKVFYASGARMYTPTVAEKVETAAKTVSTSPKVEPPKVVVTTAETPTVANYVSSLSILENTIGGLPTDFSKVFATMDVLAPESLNKIVAPFTDLVNKVMPQGGMASLNTAAQQAIANPGQAMQEVKAVLDTSSFQLPPAQNTINSPVTQTLNITMHGIPDREFAQRVMDAVRANSGHFQNMISSTVSNALARAKATSYEAS